MPYEEGEVDRYDLWDELDNEEKTEIAEALVPF